MSQRRAKRSARQHDLRVAERDRRLRAAQHADRLLAAAHLGAPAGRIDIELRSCWLTSTAVMPSACMRAGSRSTRISRSTPPPRCTCATPGTASRRLVIVLSTNQDSCSSVMLVVLTA